ncbi:MAG TPA: hypothetical protein VHF07_03655 [Nitrospiraceae bacterium]|nr:hypothetical protein [Nitrospiraceae bacterium]
MRHHWMWIGICGFLWVAGCATGSQIDETVTSDAARGSVYLERIPDPQFQAAHPIKLDVALIERTLRGVMVRQQLDVLQSLVSGQAAIMPAFSEADIAFLSPGVADALVRAAPDQQVGFRIVQVGAPTYSQRTGAAVGSSEPPLALSPKEYTSGALYAYGRSLYLSLREYRHRLSPADTVNMPNRNVPDSTGLVNRDLLFTPEVAWRSDLLTPQFSRDGFEKTLVIDLQRLALAPTAIGKPPTPAAAVPAVQASPPEKAGPPAPGDTAPPAASEIQTLKEDMKKKDSELEELRKELGAIRRRLDQQMEQTGKPATPPAKKAPK